MTADCSVRIRCEHYVRKNNIRKKKSNSAQAGKKGGEMNGRKLFDRTFWNQCRYIRDNNIIGTMLVHHTILYDVHVIKINLPSILVNRRRVVLRAVLMENG